MAKKKAARIGLAHFPNDLKIDAVSRLKNGIASSDELADEIGCSTGSISAWARDPRFNTKALQKTLNGSGEIPQRPVTKKYKPRKKAKRVTLIERVEQIESDIDELRFELGVDR